MKKAKKAPKGKGKPKTKAETAKQTPKDRNSPNRPRGDISPL
jgi:hypothetical protein